VYYIATQQKWTWSGCRIEFAEDTCSGKPLEVFPSNLPARYRWIVFVLIIMKEEYGFGVQTRNRKALLASWRETGL
jgi:hypothetical protein